MLEKIANCVEQVRMASKITKKMAAVRASLIATMSHNDELGNILSQSIPTSRSK